MLRDPGPPESGWCEALLVSEESPGAFRYRASPHIVHMIASAVIAVVRKTGLAALAGFSKPLRETIAAVPIAANAAARLT